MRKQVMKKAWEIAKKAAARHGHKASEYIGESMKIAWAIVKKENGASNERKIFGTKEIVSVVPFGKAEAVVTVTGFRFQEEHNQGAPLTISKKVSIRHNGKILGSKFEAYFAKTSNGMSKVGEAACHGEETAGEINKKIKEAEEEIKKAYAEFVGRTHVSEEQKEINRAKAIVKQAESQKEILPEKELLKKANRYNVALNESGEGYNPYEGMISEEVYENALQALA